MMGVQLANVAVIRWAPHISDRAFRVLMRMALTALDKPSNGQPAATYFGGVDLLAMTLRPERGGGEETVQRTVRRALTELVDVGAIERAERGRRGTRAVYRLTLDADPKPIRSGLQSPPIRTPESPFEAGSGLQSPNSGPLVSSLGTTGTTKDDERLDDEVVPFESPVQTAREDAATNDVPPHGEGDRSAICRRCEGRIQPDGYCFGCGHIQLRSVS